MTAALLGLLLPLAPADVPAACAALGSEAWAVRELATARLAATLERDPYARIALAVVAARGHPEARRRAARLLGLVD